MASWFGGLSSSLGCYLEPMSHSVVSFTRHISRCTKGVWMTKYETEESNELRRKEVETTQVSIRPKVEKSMTFYSDVDLENRQKTATSNDLLIEGDLDIELSLGKEILETQNLQKLKEDTQSVTVVPGFVPSSSSITAGGNVDPKSWEYEHELEQKNLEMTILTDRQTAMCQNLPKLQKTTESTSATTNLVPATPASISLGDDIDPSASEYGRKLEQQNVEMKILRGRNVALKYKLLELQKATRCLNVAAGLRPATTLASLGENMDPGAPERELEQKSLELKILRGRNIVMKHKLIKLRKATQCLNATAGLVPSTPVSTSLSNNTDHNVSEYKNQLEQQNLEMKILRGRNVAMKHKLLKLQKATEGLNVAAGLLPATSSPSLGENIDPDASEHELELEQKSLQLKILRGRHVAMKHKLIKLLKATQCLNVAAGLVPATPASTSLAENIDDKASEYIHQLEQQNLEIKILRGRNVAMKHKLLKLQKATECVNAAAGLLPMSSASLGENIDPNDSEYEHKLAQQNLEMKIQRGRNVAMEHKLLKLQKATERMNVAAGLLPAMSSAPLGENIDPNVLEYERELERKSLELKILRGRYVAMKHKLLKLRKATQCLNATAGLVPSTPVSTSLGNNIDHKASEYKNQLEQQNLELKIERGRNLAMKHQLLKLQKATEGLNAAAGLLPATSTASLSENINPSDSEYEHKLEQKSLEVKILRGRNVVMKHKLLKLQKATQCLNGDVGLVPPMPASTPLGGNIDHNAPECKNEVERQNLEMKILKGRNVAMKHKLLKLQRAIQCLSEAAGLLPATSSASLGENINPNASERKHELEQKNLEMKILRKRHTAMKHKVLKLQNANQSINVPAGLTPAMPASTSLGDDINLNTSEYKCQLELKSINHHTFSIYQHLQNRMTQWVRSKVFPTYSNINAAYHA